MTWLRKNWQWLILNGLACLVFVSMLIPLATGDLAGRELGRLVHESGEWATRFLLLSLAMTPLYILFGWNRALTLRKSTGLWAFAFAAFHTIFFVMEEGNIFSAWSEMLSEWGLILGLIPLLIMLPLALTSTNGLMRRLGKWWKPLHRTVYVAAVFALLHVAFLGHMPVPEMVLLAIFLLVRIPVVRHWFVERRQRRGKPQLAAVSVST
jgi:sulfoxide reductase heme-binding subunit YedZ